MTKERITKPEKTIQTPSRAYSHPLFAEMASNPDKETS
jgi:hypothetical protein